jgi:hypothetical protein
MSDQTPTAIGSFLAALAQKECRAIGKALANKRNRHRAVHEARKAIRRLRCLIALIRSSVGDDTSKIELALKSQSKRLSALRDAQVVAVLAEKLAANDDNGEWTAAARELAERRDALLATELAQDPDLLTASPPFMTSPPSWNSCTGSALPLTRYSGQSRKADAVSSGPSALRSRWCPTPACIDGGAV